jgi:hypothetical protein
MNNSKTNFVVRSADTGKGLKFIFMPFLHYYLLGCLGSTIFSQKVIPASGTA